MARVNENFLKLNGGYLFPEVARRTKAWSEKNKGVEILRLGIGNTTEALTPSIADAMKHKVDLLKSRDTYTGYGDEQGDTALRVALSKFYKSEYGVDLSDSEFFVSDGAKSDAANIQDVFSRDSIVAVQDPAYPVYVDSNVVGGRTQGFDSEASNYRGLVYMRADESNGFVAEPPKQHVDLMYLCFPNNPTGAVATKDQLKAFVDYALREKAIIIYDAAYCDYIRHEGIPRTIYEVEGAKECAIEINSFSKNAGFTGVRLGWSVVPAGLESENAPKGTIHSIWNRRQCTFFNGASNIAQAGGLQALSPEGRKECRSLVDYYLGNASIIREGFSKAGLKCFGGTDSPYIWTKCPNGMKSWDFFDYILDKAHVVVTPGSGFGSAGEGFVRVSAYNHRENVEAAVRSIVENLNG